MVQSHIISLLHPWKVLFDRDGEFHLHASSIICIDDDNDFHTYPMDSVGTVYKNCETSKNSTFLDLREGKRIGIFDNKLSDIIDEIRGEVDCYIPIWMIIDKLKKFVTIEHFEKSITMNVSFNGEEYHCNDKDTTVNLLAELI
jgi:hypothetical protein